MVQLSQTSINRFYLLFFLILHVGKSVGQMTDISKTLPSESTLEEKKALALQLINNVDTTAISAYWPNVKPHLFFRNLRQNVLFPYEINQGKSTNFCGYAAASHILLKYQPDEYVKVMLNLYLKGEASYGNDKLMKPSESVKKASGLLKYKGVLDIHHADQVWFLSLCDNFKGYLNSIDKHYNIGNENTFWASTNFRKFNNILAQLGIYKITSIGTDLVRPSKIEMYSYLTEKLQTGIVLMYINGKFLHPVKHKKLAIRTPTHFVALYDIKKIDDKYHLTYWDYGHKTQIIVPQKRFKKLIYGVSQLTKI